MNSFLYKFYSVLVFLCFIAKASYSQDEFQIIEARITQYLTEEGSAAKLDQDLQRNVASLQKNGSWPDIDYSSTAGTSWKPLLHLNRIKQFSLALASKNKNYTTNNLFISQTINALRYWLSVDPKSSNWFQNEIASPTAIGEILILLKNTKILPLGLQDSLIHQMSRGDVEGAVGANKLDIAIHMMYRACLSKDKALMDSAVNQAFMPITLANRQGLQSDYSYLQHGRQLQIASYGEVFLNGEYKVASWLLNTSFALSEEKLKIIDHYLVDTYLKTIRGRYIDFNTEGRGISRNNTLDKLDISGKNNNHALLALAKKVSKNNTELLNEAQQRISEQQPASFKIKPSHAYFWKGDYTLHIRPSYSFNVRTVSNRTVRTESGNNENLLGKFLPDGSTNIQRKGDEYYNIMPIWEWDKIPGVTGRCYSTDKKTTIEWGERGMSSFVGGVSDGIYGATTYKLDYDEVSAKKSWFFFDDEIVCLGSEINSFAKQPITTTINQAWAKGSVKAFANGKLITVKKKLVSDNIDWVLQDSIGYYFPKQGNLELSNQLQKGSWAKINANRSADKIEGKVFKLWFNHGTDPVNKTYSYIVKPNMSEKSMVEGQKNLPQILANDEKIQAVLNEKLQILQIVFHNSGTLITKDIKITVDQPCVVMINNLVSKNPIISLADPTQNLTTLGFKFSSKLVEETEPITVTLPQGTNKGSTVTFKVE